MYLRNSPVYKGLKAIIGIPLLSGIEKIVNNRCCFSKRSVTFGRIFKNESGDSRKTRGA